MSIQEFKMLLSDIPSSLLERISNVIHSFSTGLIKITRLSRGQENGMLIGSGTFVSVQGVYGILTAHHVSDLLELGCSLGLILVPGEHRITIDFQLLKIINIAKGSIESEGPDLSFVVLPASIVSEIKTYKQFYNLSSDREKMLETSPDFHNGIWFICGIRGDRTMEKASNIGLGKTLSIVEICGAVGVDREYASGEYDYLEAGVEYAEGLDVPQTFGGFSGGGLWQVPIKKSADRTLEPINYYLSGVVFYQSAVEGSKRFIKCHGRRSIYKKIYNRLSEIC